MTESCILPLSIPLSSNLRPLLVVYRYVVARASDVAG